MAGRNSWWANQVLRFRCTGCGDCCRQTGEVRIDRVEADRIAAFKLGEGATAESLLGDIWLEDSDGTFVIEVKGSHGCPFLDQQGCSVHEVKPEQCRTYPFWPENLESERTWRIEKKYCEGIRPDGDEYRYADIVQLLRGQVATNENGPAS